MNFKDQFIALLNKLYDVTSEGKLPWSIDDGEFETAYKCSVSGAVISIMETTDAKSDPIIQVNIKSGGKTVDTFDDDLFRGMKPQRSNHNSYWSFMTEIVEMAKRSANKSDVILRDILADLNAQYPEPEDDQW